MPANRHKPHGRNEIVSAVLDAAERLFVARGPSQVRLRDIAEEANVNVTLIYRHVGAKDDLLRAVAGRLVHNGQGHINHQSSWNDVVALLFTPTQEYFDFTHLLAWLLLEGTKPADLEQLVPVVDGIFRPFDKPGVSSSGPSIVAVLAMSFGWQVFRPLLRQWFTDSTGDADEVDERISSCLTRLAQQLPSLVALEDGQA
jgi:AcrR family transcriptional regulator